MFGLEILAPSLQVANHELSRPVSLRRWRRRQTVWLQVSDAVVVATSILSSQHSRFGALSGDPALDHWFVPAVIAISWISGLAVFRTRAPRVLGVGIEEYRRVWTATMSVFLCVSIASTICNIDIAGGYLAIALPLGLSLLTLNRHLTRRFITSQRRRGRFHSRVLVVGQPRAVDRFAISLREHPGHGYALAGTCTSSDALRHTAPDVDVTTARHRGTEGSFETLIRQYRANTVAVVSGDLNPDELRDLSWRLERLNVELMVCPGVVDIAEPRLTYRPYGGMPLIHVDKPQYHGAKKLEKRAFDVVFSILALVVTSPLLLVAAVAIKLSDQGPIFYRSERIGRDGKPFCMIKLRSMVIGADQMVASLQHLNDGNEVLFKIHRDPRVTSIGRFLRKYSIDELPQFLNVLRGDMSVVGPRPPLSSEVDSYDERVRRRLLVRPGITGLWQVSGRANLSWEESVRLDLSYVENWSMVADVAIVASTLRAVLFGNGAY
ncbi:MAG: sugar transferase [Mycolicibacterium sp.]|nr:sugar transferase [Mycolicibacterium sp.]